VSTNFDVLGIGNALMDILVPVDDAFLSEHGLEKGSMALIDNDRVKVLGDAFQSTSESPREIAGGSAGNTVVGIAKMGVKAAYLAKIGQDGVGTRLAEGYREAGLHFSSTPSTTGTPSGQCLIAVTPDGQRTMSTCLGTNTEFGLEDINEAEIKRAGTIYMEGYLFDDESAKAGFVKAAEIAQANNRLVALTLSDSFCVGRHRASFAQLVDHHVNILFANEDEMMALAEADDLETAIKAFARDGLTLCVTRSEKGSLIIDSGKRYDIPAAPVAKVVDTTGAGDQYAAGVLAGRAKGLSWDKAGYLGSLAAAEVISHFGARPEKTIQLED
jgi:sugar/nucleoside kinase (ribokinase family)